MQTVNTINKDLQSLFEGLYFNEQYHTYTVDGKRYPSATSMLNGFVIPFDRGKAQWVAKSRKITKKEVLREWDENRDAAAYMGTRVHNFAEDYALANITKADNLKPSCNKELGVIQFFMDIRDRYEIISVELRMYSKEYNFAGTADLILYDKEEDKYILADWKTNKDIHKNHANQKLLHPFDDILDTPLNKYTIQLSLYEMLLKGVNIEIEERWIIWLKEDPDNMKFYQTFKGESRVDRLEKYYDKS